jgi:hypothetical protein
MAVVSGSSAVVNRPTLVLPAFRAGIPPAAHPQILPARAPMAVTTKLQPKYSLKMIGVAVVSIVLGIWGIYDYAVGIPAKQKAYERGEVYRAVLDAIELARLPEAEAEQVTTDLQEANAKVDAGLQKLLDESAADMPTEEPSAQEIVDSIQATDMRQWLNELVIFKATLAEVARAGDRPLSENSQTAIKLLRKRVSEVGNVSEPAAYDRYVKGLLFIPCLPFGLYMFWALHRTRRKIFRLDDDHALHFPGGSWPNEQIADLDMSRWMAKSIAFVVHTDGARVKLDDYIYRNTHLIVGALASERYPEEWDAEAKPRKKQADDGAAAASDQPASEAEAASIEGEDPGRPPS